MRTLDNGSINMLYLESGYKMKILPGEAKVMVNYFIKKIKVFLPTFVSFLCLKSLAWPALGRDPA
jgi:hypothetical protein